MANYEGKPGAGAAPLNAWPAAAFVPRFGGVPSLVLFAHPQCPCTRASLEQLQKISTAAGPGLKTYVFVLKPQGYPSAWTRSALWASAAAIPGTTVLPDPGGTVAEAFGAKTSGQTFLFDRAGRLVFSGGITVSRGRAGEDAWQ